MDMRIREFFNTSMQYIKHGSIFITMRITSIANLKVSVRVMPFLPNEDNIASTYMIEMNFNNCDVVEYVNNDKETKIMLLFGMDVLVTMELSKYFS
jgi:hypothetical protein